jgi:hypothetical protein
LSEFAAKVVVEGLETGVEAGNLRGKCLGKMDKAGILLGGRGLTHEKEDQGGEDGDLEDKDEGKHFGFPSPLRIALGRWKAVNFVSREELA